MRGPLAKVSQAGQAMGRRVTGGERDGRRSGGERGAARSPGRRGRSRGPTVGKKRMSGPASPPRTSREAQGTRRAGEASIIVGGGKVRTTREDWGSLRWREVAAEAGDILANASSDGGGTQPGPHSSC